MKIKIKAAKRIKPLVEGPQGDGRIYFNGKFFSGDRILAYAVEHSLDSATKDLLALRKLVKEVGGLDDAKSRIKNALYDLRLGKVEVVKIGRHPVSQS